MMTYGMETDTTYFMVQENHEKLPTISGAPADTKTEHFPRSEILLLEPLCLVYLILKILTLNLNMETSDHLI
jgi:hypothetical protein